MQPNYWTRTLAARISRRRAMAAMGAGTAGSALLIACGSDGDGTSGDGTGGGDSNGLVAQPADTTKAATRDGVLKDYVTSESQTLDPVSPVAPLNQVIKFTYGAL